MTNKTTSAIDLVERVARAIAAEVGRQDGDEPLDADWIADGIFKWNLVAQAAIDASGLADTITRLQAALDRIAHEARQSADTYGCANCNAHAEIARLSSVGGE